MESTMRNLSPARSASKITTIAYWVVTALFCLEMLFTAYYETLPQGIQAFARLGFTNSYFAIELSLGKLAGVVILLLPFVPARLKEWAYAAFAVNLISAIAAHASIHDIPAAFAPSMITSVLWALSYALWRRREIAPRRP
jgi:hypothetical protein